LANCQQSRRARLAIDFSTGWACTSHASDVLGMCVMITSALLRTETERWREEYNVSRPAGSYRWVCWQAWHDTKIRDRLSSEAAQLPSPVTDQKLLLPTDFCRQVIFPIAYRPLQFPIRQVHKLLICTLVNKLLTITRRNFSKANMSLSHLPPELLGLILENIFSDERNHYRSGLKVLNLRTVCRKYSKRVF
jgi:hypothetical protein